MAMADCKTVEVKVYGLAGPVCGFKAEWDWTIQKVKEAIMELTATPSEEQVLILGTKPLNDEAEALAKLVGWDTSAHPETLALTLVKEKPLPAPEALWAAITSRDTEQALALLRRPEVPGLNEVYNEGWTLLHTAAAYHLEEVALALLQRADFSLVNAKSRWGSTALHDAVIRGSRVVCQAIVDREDFTELAATVRWGGFSGTARMMARQLGKTEIASLLSAAEVRDRPWWSALQWCSVGL